MHLQKPPTAGYGFNKILDIKSHSSALFNERLAIYFYLLDVKSMTMYHDKDTQSLTEAFAAAKVIYSNIRMLIRFNPVVRVSLNLETKDPGIYITDVMKGTIEQMIEYCEINGYTYRRITILIYEIERFGMLIRDTLQFFQYFIRPDFRQKPDLEVATEKYKEIADKHTIEELRKLVGKHSKIDFESLGQTNIAVPMLEDQREDGDTTPDQLEYDDEIDGPVELSDDDDPTIKGALDGGNPFDSKYEPQKRIARRKTDADQDTLGIKEMPGDEMQKFATLNQTRINDERRERKTVYAKKRTG